jgi:DNA-binding LacI/PurR family transcriptional regulator
MAGQRARPPRPALTVVTQPIVEMAKTANALLLSLLEDPETIRLEVFPPDLVIR